MKKTFHLNVPKHKPERQLDAIRHEIKKYLARERRKTLPEGADFWEFDCRMGDSEESAAVVQESEIKSLLGQLIPENKETFYLEILAKPGYKPKKDD